MSENQAHDMENLLIESYKKINQCQTNFQLGGWGFQYMTGEKNPMYGKPWFTEDTPQEKIDEWKKKIASPGERNAMYGVSPRERMDEETYRGWIDGHKKIVGDKNPNYGNRKLSAFYASNPDAARENQSRPGIRNGRCVPVELFDESLNSVGRFDYMGECADYLVSHGFTQSKSSYVAIRISESIKSGVKIYGHYFKLADRE